MKITVNHNGTDFYHDVDIENVGLGEFLDAKYPNATIVSHTLYLKPNITAQLFEQLELEDLTESVTLVITTK